MSAVSQPLGITPGPVKKSGVSTGAATQPIGISQAPATKFGISKGTGNQALVTTPGKTISIPRNGDRSPKRPRVVFGNPKSCNKCAEVRRSLNYELAMVKKERAAENKQVEKVTVQNKELRESRSRMESSIKFLEGLITKLQNECAELKKKNQKLLFQQSEIRRIFMK